MQIEILNAALTTAEAIMSKKTTTGREIGYFYADALTTLSSLYEKAKAAAENNDTSVHSYKEWTRLLNDEIARLKNDLNARAYLKELDEYRVINANEKLYQLCYDATGLKANKQNQTAVTSPDKKWLVESTGEMHHYYIKNYNGLYISDYTLNGNTLCNGNSQSTATVFKANYLDDGRIYFTTKNEGAFLTLGSDYKVVCSTDFVDASLWTIVRVTSNNTGIEEVTENADERTVYDLTGRRIERITSPGIYIINGKKVMVN